MSSINNISLYIPHVFANISKEFIAEIFEKLRIGKILSIDFVYKLGRDAPYNTAYVHFEYWYENTAAYNFQERVLNPEKEAKIIYDDPWYWIVFENKAKKHVSGDRKPRIALGLQEDIIAPINEKRMMTNKDFSELINNVPSKKFTLAEAFATVQLNHSEDLEKVITNNDEQFQELEALMEENDQDLHLISIDARYVEQLEEEAMFITSNVQYVNALENENQDLKNEINFLRASLAQMSQRY